MDRKLIKSEAKEALKDKWFMFFIILLIVGGISGISAGILGPILAFGTYLVILDLLDGKEVNANRYGEIFKDLNHLLKLVGVGLLTSIIVSVGLVLFVIPGIIFSLMLSQASYIMIENPQLSVVEALKRSKAMMHGYKMDYLVFNLSFLGHALLVSLTFGIYGIYYAPLITVAQANYYRHLKQVADPNVIEAEVVS